VFLVWAFVLSLAVYSWAGEKFAWLILHPLLPLLLLAGIGVQAIWDSRRHWFGRLGIVAAIVAFAYAGYASYLANAKYRADPRELLVSTQSSETVADVADQVVARAQRAERAGRPFSVTIDAAEGATFPWAWYFRDLPVGYLDMTNAELPSDTDVAILTEGNRDRVLQNLAGYDGRRFPFRVWWVRDYDEMSPEAWWRWVTERKPWNPTGGMREWLFVRQGA
jgi:predicted membrane-bound mannosyltransferase